MLRVQLAVLALLCSAVLSCDQFLPVGALVFFDSTTGTLSCPTNMTPAPSVLWGYIPIGNPSTDTTGSNVTNGNPPLQSGQDATHVHTGAPSLCTTSSLPTGTTGAASACSPTASPGVDWTVRRQMCASAPPNAGSTSAAGSGYPLVQLVACAVTKDNYFNSYQGGIIYMLPGMQCPGPSGSGGWTEVKSGYGRAVVGLHADYVPPPVLANGDYAIIGQGTSLTSSSTFNYGHTHVYQSNATLSGVSNTGTGSATTAVIPMTGTSMDVTVNGTLATAYSGLPLKKLAMCEPNAGCGVSSGDEYLPSGAIMFFNRNLGCPTPDSNGRWYQIPEYAGRLVVFADSFADSGIVFGSNTLLAGMAPGATGPSHTHDAFVGGFVVQNSTCGTDYAQNTAVTSTGSYVLGVDGGGADFAVASTATQASVQEGIIPYTGFVMCRQTYTFSPTNSPATTAPTASPQSRAPTRSPSKAPSTSKPTIAPSTSKPSIAPSTSKPSFAPSMTPTTSKPTTALPTFAPSTTKPTTTPTTSRPSKAPASSVPTFAPSTARPTAAPSKAPATSLPTASPHSQRPSLAPSLAPLSKAPSRAPSSAAPTGSPSSAVPTRSPSRAPATTHPTGAPTTSAPSASPTARPTKQPHVGPSQSPVTVAPTYSPSRRPSRAPTSQRPTAAPSTAWPTLAPSLAPVTSRPSSAPTRTPTRTPTRSPVSHKPSSSPTAHPSKSPSPRPTKQPHIGPSQSPVSVSPTLAPSRVPSMAPTSSAPTTGAPAPTTSEPTTALPTSAAPTRSPTLASPSSAPSTESPTPPTPPTPAPSMRPVALGAPTASPRAFNIAAAAAPSSDVGTAVGATIAVMFCLAIIVVVVRKRIRGEKLFELGSPKRRGQNQALMVGGRLYDSSGGGGVGGRFFLSRSSVDQSAFASSAGFQSFPGDSDPPPPGFTRRFLSSLNSVRLSIQRSSETRSQALWRFLNTPGHLSPPPPPPGLGPPGLVPPPPPRRSMGGPRVSKKKGDWVVPSPMHEQAANPMYGNPVMMREVQAMSTSTDDDGESLSQWVKENL